MYNYKNKDIEKKCNYFINKNCDIEALNNDNETPLYYLCTLYTKNIEDQKYMIHFLLDSGSSINYSHYKFKKQKITNYLRDDIDLGYNKHYVDMFYGYLIDLFNNYNHIIDCSLYSSLESFRYILRNNKLDIKKKLFKYSMNKMFVYDIDKKCFYDKTYFNYKKTLLYLFNNENSENNFYQYYENNPTRNKLILKYIEDSFTKWKPCNHYIQNWCLKESINNMLIIKNRLVKNNTFYLPDELWFKIFPFLKFDY